MRWVIMLLLCLVSLQGQAQLTASKFVDKLVSIEMELQETYLRNEFEIFTSAYADVEQNDYNYELFAKVIIIHQLFASNGPYDGDSFNGDIPYFMHYTDPNPRALISKAGQPINYNGDRTPDMFLADFFSDTKYIHPEYGEFSTFGWCSEREMAYSTMLNTLGFRTYIKAPGAHAWTNVQVVFDGYQGQIYYGARVDNTFNSVSWSTWIEPVGYSNGLEQFYNQRVTKNKYTLDNIYVSPARQTEIMKLFSY